MLYQIQLLLKSIFAKGSSLECQTNCMCRFIKMSMQEKEIIALMLTKGLSRNSLHEETMPGGLVASVA